jgi:steroid delta-isomerase-like uncharacterized protein
MTLDAKALARRLVEEVWSRGELAVADELVAADYVGHSSSPETGGTRGREGYKQYFAARRGAFPDIRFTVEDQVAEGDRVVTRWTARGTHAGEFAGVPPTGRAGVVSGTTTYRLADGKVAECWTNADDLGLLRLIGAVPAPGRAA